MISFNHVSISGRLVRDPEMHTFASGSNKTTVCLAVNKRVKNKLQDEWKDETSFIEVAFWGKSAQTVAEQATKGSEMAVVGELKQESWERDGKKQSKLIVNSSSFLIAGATNSGPRPSDGLDFHTPNKPQTEAQMAADDVPF